MAEIFKSECPRVFTIESHYILTLEVFSLSETWSCPLACDVAVTRTFPMDFASVITVESHYVRTFENYQCQRLTSRSATRTFPM